MIAKYDSMPSGFTDTILVEYEVKESDLPAGEIINFARMTYLMQQIAFEIDSNEVPSRIGSAVSNREVSITKTETSHPDKGGRYQLGEWIEYSIEVRNLSKETLPEAVISDRLEYYGKEDVLVTVYGMPPDKRFTQTFKHQVTTEDVQRGKVINYGVVTYTWEDGNSSRLESEPVISLTGADETDECIRTLTTLTENQADYSLSFCQDHRKVNEEVMQLINAASTDAEKLAAYQEGTEIWLKTMEEIYQKLITQTEKDIASSVLNSQTKFRNYLNAYETVIRAVITSNDTEVAARILDQLRMRCVDLCYALHHAPAPDCADSLIGFSKGYTAGSASVSFTFSSISVFEENGVLRLSVSLSEECADIEKGIMDALKDSNSDEDIADAFMFGELQYRLALNTMLISGQNALDRDFQRAILLFNDAVNAYLDGDLLMYQELYPERPDIAAEIVCREALEIIAFLQAGQ